MLDVADPANASTDRNNFGNNMGGRNFAGNVQVSCSH